MPSVRFINAKKPPGTARRDFTVDFIEPHLNLLAHAQSIELDIGSRCGGHGICGGDRIRIVSEADRMKLSALTEHEREHLSQDEIKNGFRLACQCFPDAFSLDLSVEFDSIV